MINHFVSSKLLKRKFARVYKRNLFHGAESRSGRGSDLDQTHTIEQEIPKILKELRIKSILDVPCGDLNWIRRIDLSEISYVGADIVSNLIDYNLENYSSESKSFVEFDLSQDVPPKTDLILCRDLFVHLNTKSIERCILNIKSSGSTYLLTTTFTNSRKYIDLPLITRNVAWRAINLQMKPFFFPQPMSIINENCTEADHKFADKSLGLWRINQL